MFGVTSLIVTSLRVTSFLFLVTPKIRALDEILALGNQIDRTMTCKKSLSYFLNDVVDSKLLWCSC